MTVSLPKVMDVAPASKPLRIAVVYSRVPFPMMRGDQTTVAHLLSFLRARHHIVDLHSLNLDGHLTDTQRGWLEEACAKVFLHRHSMVAKAIGLLRAIATGEPLQVGLFHNRKLIKQLRSDIDSGRYDIVYCYYPRSAPAVVEARAGHQIPSVLGMQLSQALNTARMAAGEQNTFRKIIYAIEARRVERFEAKIWQHFDQVGLIGPKDVAAVIRSSERRGEKPIDNWFYAPHGTDTSRFSGASVEEVVANRVVFSGSMLYPPNIQAVDWFVRNVWGLIRASVPAAEFFIQGRDPAPSVRALDGKDGITVTGTVPDVGHLIRSATVCVNPMRAAGGMQNKLIEYFASGKAVVATSIANEGIMAPQDVVRIADEARAFADEVIDLLRSSTAAAELGRRARVYALAEWTWEKHFKDLDEVFASLTGRN